MIAASVAALHIRSTIKCIPALFRRNAELKAQGYYMGEFEFKMLAAQWHLNEGNYTDALAILRRIRDEMETTKGLVRMPANATPAQQMAFLLDRQDPTTGAFMDPRYPYFTWFAPTENVIEALDLLARQTSQPLKLKYPLRFLDDIHDPPRLRAYLDSLLYLKEPWASIAGGPGPYGPGVSELASYARLETLGLYPFSEQWKQILRRWFLDTQDPSTGFWGHRIGTPSHWQQRMDVNSTYHVLKLFSEDRASRSIPHAGQLARSLLPYLDRPIPRDASGQHEWSLVQAQGARMINWLWDCLSEPEQDQARKAMAAALTLRYQHFFRPADGGFSLYTGDAASDIDGTANALALLRATGSMPGTRERQRLWGKALAAGPPVLRGAGANSLRVYANAPPAGDTYDDPNLIEIIATGDAPIRDVMDLRQHISRMLASGNLTFGNWASRESLRGQPLDLRRPVKAVRVSHHPLDLARLSREHPRVRKFTVVGYDVFQVPVFRFDSRASLVSLKPRFNPQDQQTGRYPANKPR